MLDLKRFTDNDNKDYAFIKEFVDNHYQNKDGEYFTFLYKDEERVLYKAGNIFSIFYFDEAKGYVDFTMFEYDQDAQQIYVNLGNYLLHISRTTEALEDENGIIHYINIVKGKEDCLGFVYYSQVDTKNDKALVLFYDHHYMAKSGEKQRIYGMRLHDPTKIAIRNKASKKINRPYMPTNSKLYAKVEYKDVFGSPLYNFLKDETNNKYYRIVACTKNGHLLYLPIITTGYSKNEMMDIIKREGFGIEVPEELLSLYNGDLIDVSYYWEIVDEVLLLDKGMTFKMGGSK